MVAAVASDDPQIAAKDGGHRQSTAKMAQERIGHLIKLTAQAALVHEQAH